MERTLLNQFILTTRKNWQPIHLTNLKSPSFIKTFSSAFMVFALMLFMGFNNTANAQVTIGTGTSSSSFTPIYSCYGYSYTEQIYLQSEIGTSGSITSVSFYVNSLPSTTASSDSFTVYLGHTTLTDYSTSTSWVGSTTMTEVYNGSVTYPTAGNWMTITLSTPFAYNNIDNLVVAVDENRPGWNCSVNWAYTTAGANSSIYYRNDATNPDPALPPSATGRTANRANIQLGGITQACPAPTAFAASSITTSGASIAWTSGSNLSNVEYGPAGFTPGTGTTLTGVTSPQTLSGFSPATAYDVYIIDNCGAGGLSIPLTGSFSTTLQGAVGVTCTTPGANSTVVFTEDFENNNAGWTGSINSGNTSWEIPDASGSGSTGASNGHLGGNFANYEASTTSTNQGSMVSPAIDLSAAVNDAELSFWMHAYGATMGTLNVGVGTSASGPFTTVFTWSGQLQTSGTAPWENVGVNLASYVGQTIYLQFTQIDDQGGFTGDMCIDLVEVTTCLSCVAPSALTATNITATSAEVSWTPGLSETAWDVQYGLSGFTIGTGDSMTASNPDTIMALLPNTTYDYYVRADCGGTSGVSGWAGPFTFTTLCAGQISGTVTIDANLPASATNFQSFNDLANEINACGIGGALTVNVAAGTYNEAVTFEAISGTSASNTITINGGGATIAYDGSGTQSATIRLRGTDHMTIDNLTIVNTESASYGWGIHLVQAADSNTISNCTINIDQSSTGSTFAGIIATNSNTSTGSYANNANYTMVSNTTVNGGYYGVRFNGLSATYNMNNSVMNSTFNEVRFYGVYNIYQEAPMASGNTVNFRSSATGGYGVYINNSIHGNVQSNFINGAKTYGIYFVTHNQASKNPTVRGLVANNMITALNFGDGIYFSNADQMDVFHNTVTAENDQALWINSTTDDYDVRNNVFSITGSTYVIDLDAAPAVATETLNNNVYYNSGTGSIAQVASTNYATLVAWQTGDADQNSNSLEGDPVFAGPTDLHLLGPLANDAGDNTVGITVDIDGDTRPATGSTIVDIGADEFTAVSGDLAMLAGMIQPSPCYSSNDTAVFYVQNVIGGTVDFSVNSLTLTWDVMGPFANSNGSVTVNSGTLPAGDTLMVIATGVDVSAAGNYMLNAYIGPNGANQSAVNDTLSTVSFSESSLLLATPSNTVITSGSDTVELAAFSPYFPNGGFFITEICHFAGSSTGAPAGGKPSWLFSDDYIEITGSPGSDLGGYTLETWTTSTLTYTHTFPSGTLLSPNGTAIIGVGSSVGSDSPSDFYYTAQGGSYSSGSAAGRIIKDPQGNIEDAVGYSGSTSTAYVFPAGANVSSTDWSSTLLGGSGSWGTRLEGADVNSGTNWVLSATSSQNPNDVNTSVTVPATPAVTGFTWSLNGNTITSNTTTIVGPWMANNNGSIKYIAAYNSASCGMVYDTATVVVNIPCGDTIMAPFFDGFEVGNTYSACWSQEQVTGTKSWTFGNGSSGGSVLSAKTGSLNARFTSSFGGPHVTRLISPFIDASGLTVSQLSFAYAQEVWFGDQNFLNVYYRDSANGAWNVVFSDSTNKAAWTDVIVSVPSSSSTLQLAFEGVDNYGRAVVVDDVALMETPSCPAPLALGGVANSTSSADVFWTSTAASFQIEYDTTGFMPGMGSMMVVTNDTASITGLMASTNYDFYVRAICGPGDTSAWSGPGSFFTGYCTPNPSTVDGTGITNVTMGGVNNTTGAEPGNYGDYTALVANGSLGANFPIDVTLATGYTYNLWVWIDWNDDLDFDDPNEEFYLGNSSSTNPTTFNGSITIPSTAPVGNHRFRLGGADSGLGSTPPSDPCYTGSWGSFEDYTLNVQLLQVDLPITFDDPLVNYDPVSFGSAIDSIITDPTDSTNMVLRQDKPTGAQTWAGTTLGGSGLANQVPFTATETYMNARVWSPDSGTAVLLKVENTGNGALSVETMAYTSSAGVWETLNFDFSNHASGTPPLNLTTVYDKVSIFCEFGNAGSGKTYFVDDVQFGPFLSQVDLPITFDDPLIDYNPISFGSAIDSIITDPTDPTNLVLRQDKPIAAQTWAGTTLGGSGLANPVPFALGSTVMTARVWSPDSGTAVLLKVENTGNAAQSVETMAYTSAAATWETLIYDFTNHATGTPPLSFTTVYDKVSVFCEFGNVGSGKTYFVDDVAFGLPPCSPYVAPFAESFDSTSIPNCWSQTSVAGGPWLFSGSTNSVNCTAASDNTGNSGSFAWMDHSGTDDSVSLIMPVIDVSSLTIPWLQFDYWMCGVGYSPANKLYIDTWNGTSWVTADSITVATSGWETYGFDLTGFTHGANLLEARLRTESGGSTSDFFGDPAIDNVTVDEKPSACPIADIVTVGDETSCGPNPVTFSASYTSQFGMLAWMNSDSAVVQTGGSNYTTAPVTATTDYMAQVFTADGSAAQHVGPLTNIATSGYGNFSNGQWFSVLDDFVLDSITVNSNGSTEFFVQISEPAATGAGDLLQVSDTISVTGAGDHQVPVNLFLRPGNYFINVGFVTGTTGQLFRATGGAVYPYTISNVVSIDSVNIAAPRLYYTFDWVVSTACVGPVETFQAIQGAVPSTAFPYAEDFDTGLPCNWSTDALATGEDWMNVANYSGNSIDGTNFMFLDDDAPGSGAITEASLISPVFNTQGYDTVFMEFDHYYRHITGTTGFVEVYDGTAWVAIATYTATVGSWVAPVNETFDVTPYQNTDFQVRFRYDDGGAWGWYWAVDNFEMDGIQTPCENVVVDILTDSWGSETTWSIVDTATGTTYASGGPYPDGILTHYVDSVCLPLGVFFEFRLNDSFGDGLFDGVNTGTYDVDIICSWGSNNVISGMGAYPFGGAAPLPNPSWDSTIFEVTCAQPGCFDPIVVSDSSNCSTLFVDWISDTSATTRLEYGLSGFTPGTGTLLNAVTAPYILTGLTNSATYDYYLVDSCSNGNLSDTVWGTQFTTDPLPVAGFIKALAPPAGRLDTVTWNFNAAPSQFETLQVWNYGDGSPLDSGLVKTHDYTANGTFDVILYVYNSCGVDSDTQEVVVSTVGLDEFGINDLMLYPNPNKGRFTLNGTLDVGGEIQIQVLSMTGALVHSQKINTGQQIDVDIDLTGEASGVYQVRIISAKGVTIKPFIIQD